MSDADDHNCGQKPELATRLVSPRMPLAVFLWILEVYHLSFPCP
jgi:hypothetical protein